MDLWTYYTLSGIEMDMEFKRKELEDADAMRDAQRKISGTGSNQECYYIHLQ